MKGFPISLSPRKLGFKALSVLLVLAILAAALPASVLAAPDAATCSTNYIVKSGDTLSSIALTYKVTTAELAAANNLKEPYTLYIGQALCIPGTAPTSTSSTSTTSNQKINATFTATSVTFKLSGLTKNGRFTIKGRKYDRHDSSWYRFGHFKANKNGGGTVTLKLPRILREPGEIQICFKNATNDKVWCQRFNK
jgi:murein DD-endopeptidase MepM/ murein hydrolase activator NlpD